MKLYDVFILMLVFILFGTTFSKRGCGMHKLNQPQRVLIDLDETQITDGKMKVRQNYDVAWENIRIHFDFSKIEKNKSKLKPEDYTILQNEVIPVAKKVLESLLKVRPVSGKLKLNAPTCDVWPIPVNYITEGVDADLVIFVDIDHSGFYKENSIEAAATFCLQNRSTKRPIAGYITYAPDLKIDNQVAIDYFVWLTLHEITHVLVLNKSLYDDFIYSETLKPLGYEKVFKEVKREDNKVIKYITTPKVVEKARAHFNCQDLIGVPLEFNGGAGTAGSHWSKKFMNTDYMIGDSYGENLISEITLALFEDSGWYQVKYDKANLFLWGKNKGCDFYNDSCLVKDKNKNNETKFKDEYCTKFNRDVCSISNIFKGICQTKKYQTELPQTERYFDDPFTGGVDALTDKCPIPIEKDDANKIYYPGSCRFGDASNSSKKFEKICENCACVLNNLSQSDNGNLKHRFKQTGSSNKNDKIEESASCLEYVCLEEKLYIRVSEKQYLCQTDKIIKIEGYEGEIKCPNAQVLCNNRYKCKFGCT
jgi:hypothetical protein